MANIEQELLQSLAGEHALSGQELEKDDSSGEDVRAPVDRLAAHLLGRHVRRRALDRPSLGGAQAADRLGHAEIDQLELAFERQHEVAETDIAVDEIQRPAAKIAPIVSVVERLAKLDDRVARDGRWQPATRFLVTAKDGAEIAPLDVLHGDVAPSVDVAEVIDLRNVCVAQPRGDVGLVGEIGQGPAFFGHLAVNPLDRDQSLQPVRFGQVDLTHTPFAEQVEQCVLSELLQPHRIPLSLSTVLDALVDFSAYQPYTPERDLIMTPRFAKVHYATLHSGAEGRTDTLPPMKCARVVFAVLLLLSGAVTAFLGLRTLVDPEGMMVAFGAPVTRAPGIELLMAVLGAVVLSIALFVLLAGWWSWQNRSEGRTLGILAAATLILVALCAFWIADSTQLLLLDGVRGVVLLVAGFLWKPADE